MRSSRSGGVPTHFPTSNRLSAFALTAVASLVAGAVGWLTTTTSMAAEGEGAGPRVVVVVGPQAPALERHAASELAELLRKLFAAQVTIATTVPPAAAAAANTPAANTPAANAPAVNAKVPALILLGSPATNPAIAAAARSLPEGWPKLSEQGHWLRSVGATAANPTANPAANPAANPTANPTATTPANKSATKPAISSATTPASSPMLLVGGGSPVATLWAAYEVGYHFGVRYLPTGDALPAQGPPFSLAGIDRVWEPTLRTRAWQTLGDQPAGAESWSLAEQRRLIAQLAKLKFNRLVIETRAWQPFIDFTANGVRKQSAVLLHGQLYPVNGDTAGRAAFRGATLFENPDFAGRSTYAERLAAGRELVAGMIAQAQELGMEAVALVRPLEFPREFAAALPGSRVLDVPGQLAIGPGERQTTTDATLRAIAVSQLTAYAETYPTLDALYLDISGSESWKPSGAGTPLEFVLSLLDEPSLAQRGGLRRRQLGLAGVDRAAAEALASRPLPAGTAVLHSLGSSARRAALTSDWVQAATAADVAARSELTVPLGSSAIGVVPQMQTGHVRRLLEATRQAGWQGVTVNGWMAGDLAPGLHFLSRACFDSRLTPPAALAELIDSVSGEEVAPRLLKGFGLLEEATDLLDASDASFAECRPDMLTKHAAAGAAPPEAWAQAKKNYAAAMDEMYRGNTRARQGGRFFTLYFAKRFEFGLHYMTCVEALRNSGVAKAAGDEEKRVAELEKALESLHSALAAYADVARDPSDRGAIAVLNRHGYRVLGEALDAP